MSSQPVKDIQVAIVGGGVCGITCAIALIKRGVSVQVYESAAHFGEIGAGLGIGANAVRVLQDLDLLNDVASASQETIIPGEPVPMAWFQFLSGMEGHELILDYPTLPGEGSIGSHRAAFLDALVKHIDLKLIHFHKRCTGVVQSEAELSKLTIKFADGTDASADVVLGADGLKSAVREAVTGLGLDKMISFSNTVCYRAIIPAEVVRAAGVTRDYRPRPICYAGKDKHLIAYAIQGGTLINIVAFSADHSIPIGERKLPADTPAIVPVEPQKLLEEFQGWGSEVVGLLSCVTQPARWIINVVYPPLPSYVNGRIALLGDAAHAMLPHLGAGAGQGIEDAEAISRLLSHPETTLNNVEEVLKVYDEVRRPRAESVWKGSVLAGQIPGGHGPSGDSVNAMRKDLAGLWDFVWRHDLEADLQVAVQTLQKRGIFTTERTDKV